MKKNACKWLIGLLLISLFSCKSLQQDIVISSMDESAKADLLDLEEKIVNLESAPQLNAMNDTRKQISSLSGIPDNEFQAFLSAWSGRLYLLEGQNDEAARELKKSQTLSPGNWGSVILASRLDLSMQGSLGSLDEALKNNRYFDTAGGTDNGAGEIQIERGRILLALNRFSEAVASFDLAFGLLADKPFYRANYLAARNRAWDLRNIGTDTGAKTVEIASQDGVSWKDIIDITKTETDLLRFLTGGQDWPSEQIFSRLLERSFIPATQDITLMEWPQTLPKSSEIVQRSGTAWFLWRLYAENRANRGLLSRYSSRYANIPDAKSPISDLPMLSPFFDSILGCVELEFMSLPDGKNFVPNDKIKGSEFLAMLKKIN